MFKKIRRIATVKMGGSLIYYLIRLYSATCRLRLVNEEEWLDYLETGGRVLLCCWHQQFFIGMRLFTRYKKYSTYVMISKSTDGDIVSRVAEAAKLFPVRGSSSKSGGAALKQIIGRLKSGKLAVHLLDGPRGPAGVVKAGAVAIASGAGAAIVPVHVQADRAWYAHSWDKFMVPKPFARVTVTFCPLMKIDGELDSHQHEVYRQQLEDKLKPYLKR